MMSPGLSVNSNQHMQKQFNRFKVRAICAIAASVLAVNTAWAVNPFVVRDIRVEGLRARGGGAPGQPGHRQQGQCAQ